MQLRRTQADQVVQMDVKDTDLASWLIAEAEKTGFREEDMRWLAGDAATVVVAGRYGSHFCALKQG